MHNRALHDSLAAFVEEAARQLADEVSGGAEVPFELMEKAPPTRASAPLYCYRPLTGRFIADRIGVLARLPSYPAAVQGLAALPDLPAYLQARRRRTPGPDSRSQADAALQAFLTAVWSEATDFIFEPHRFADAFGELEATAYAGCTLSVVLAPIVGLVIESDEVALGEGLALVRAGTLRDAPGDLGEDDLATVAVLALEGAAGDDRALEGAGRRLRRLQTALRLWDDAEPALHPTAWARTEGSAWFAGRALLADSGQPGYEGMAERMAAICAAPEDRPRVERGLLGAISLERAAVAGLVRPEPEVEHLISSVGANLRAMLRDILCGHLEPDVRRLADELLEQEPEAADTLP
jgi:hypothetical protein